MENLGKNGERIGEERVDFKKREKLGKNEYQKRN